MSTSYHRDAFAELMSQIGQNEMDRAFSAGEYSGGGKQEESASGQGDFFQNLVNGILSAPAATTGVSGPGFSVGSIGSTAYMPAGRYDGNAPITEGFSSDVFGTSMFQQPVNFAGASNALDTVYMSDVFGADSPLVTDLSGGFGDFYGPDKLYPGDVGAGYDPDAYYASKGYTRHPITGKLIDLSKYNVTGGGDASSTTGQLPTSTSTAGGANEVLVTGQSGGNTGLTAANTGAGILGANTNIAGEVVATGSQDANKGLTAANTGAGILGATLPTEMVITGSQEDGKDLTVANTGAGILGATLPTELIVTGSQDDDSDLIKSVINNPIVKGLDAVTGGKINEIISIGRAIKDDGFVKAALGALNLGNITLADTGNTYVDSDFELLMPGGVDLDSRSNIENVGSTGTGGGDGRSIPQRTAIRSVVPGTYDPNRRAGSGGQRYFSDVQYVPNVADPAAQRAANLATQAQTNTQAMQLAYQNALNPAYQTRPGTATDRATSMVERAVGISGMLPTAQVGAGLTPAAATTGTAVNPNAALEELVQTLIAGPAATGTTTGTTGATTGTTGATTGTTGATTGTTGATTGTTGATTGTTGATTGTTGATTGTTGATTGTTGATTGTTGATTGTTGTANTGTTTTNTSPYTYTSESLFQGIDASDGFDETEIGRVAYLMNQDYTTAGQVGEFFNMSPEDVNRYLGDYNKRTELIKDLGLTEGQQGFTFDQLGKIGASGLENQYLADTFGVDADALQRAIGGASTITGLDSANGLSLDQQGTIAGLLESGDVSVNNVASLYGITPEEVQAGYSTYKNTVAQNAINETIDSGDFGAIAELITSNKAGISDVASRQGVEGMDVVEQLLRGGYETPAQMAARLAPANEGLTEVDLVANLLNTGRAKPEEVASYYRNTDPEQFADLTGADVEQYLADINQQNTTDYLKGLSDEEVGALINSGGLEIGEAVKFYQDRYPGLTLADAQASMKAMGYAQGGNVQGYYLGGATDGMADQIPATINNMQPAALSDGEFVIPADVVSHLGNGNSDSGAKELYSMMDRIRQDRTGTTKQGRQIDPNKYLA
jgi:hypothetical protein